ncbi:MAG: aldehyde dehydrogenase family protein [Rhodobacterales bacterium]|nr:aldehyde dehydrogenase family protein [Rhodobacterales bacterium]
MSRLSIQKTLKLYIGGKFPRSESGRTAPIKSVDGSMINVAKASRKDLRDAVGIARKAQAAWAGRTAYNRGQVLYRLGELMECRSGGMATSDADRFAAIDRAVHHAGWSDKITAVLSSLNPVSNTFVNYSKIRPLGVVVAIPDPADGLLGMTEAICASAVMGNGTLLIVPLALAETALALAECLATSDWPGGVVNVLTGDVAELLAVASKHDDVDGLYLGGASAELNRKEVDVEAARVMRRVLRAGGASTAASPMQLQKLSEVQTVWMSSFEPKGGAAAY